MPFPEKKYHRLQELQKRWKAEWEDIVYAIENGCLRACIWLPFDLVERGYKKDGRYVPVQTDYEEGLVAVRPNDCRQIFSTGKTLVSCFMSLHDPDERLRFSDESRLQAMELEQDHLVIWENDVLAFEAEHGLTGDKRPHEPLIKAKAENAGA